MESWTPMAKMQVSRDGDGVIPKKQPLYLVSIFLLA